MTGHGERVSALDASLLALDGADGLLQAGFSATFTAPTGARRPGVRVLRARIQERAHLVPRCRQRLVAPPLGRLGQPRWADDPDFRVADHVVGLAPFDAVVPMDAFARLRDEVLAQPLPPDRPLWQIDVVPRLEGGRVGIIGRLHHAMTGGDAARIVSTLLLDGEGPDPEAARPRAWRPAPGPPAWRWAADPVLDAARAAGRLALSGARAGTRPRRTLLDGAQAVGRMASAVLEDAVVRAPSSSLNRPTGPRRTLAGCRLPAEPLRAVADAHAVTLDDVVLALVTGALRTLAEDDGLAPRRLRALLPAAGSDGSGPTAVWLPLHLEDPADRLLDLAGQRRSACALGRSEAHRAVVSALAAVPRPARDVVVRAATSPAAFNLVVTVLRAPARPPRLFDLALEELVPAGPVAAGHALAVAAVVAGDVVHLGLHADPEGLPGAARPAELLAAEARALRHDLADLAEVVPIRPA